MRRKAARSRRRRRARPTERGPLLLAEYRSYCAGERKGEPSARGAFSDLVCLTAARGAGWQMFRWQEGICLEPLALNRPRELGRQARDGPAIYFGITDEANLAPAAAVAAAAAAPRPSRSASPSSCSTTITTTTTTTSWVVARRGASDERPDEFARLSVVLFQKRALCHMVLVYATPKRTRKLRGFNLRTRTFHHLDSLLA